MKTLNNINCGEEVKVLSLCGERPIKRRFMDMGITRGVSIYVRKLAPLGDPIEINVRGYSVILRKEDALKIIVQ